MLRHCLMEHLMLLFHSAHFHKIHITDLLFLLCFHFFFLFKHNKKKINVKIKVKWDFFVRLKIGDFHSIMCFICSQWAPFSVRRFFPQTCYGCAKTIHNNNKKDVCHKTKQMIAMKKKGSRLIVFGVSFLFIFSSSLCWMYFVESFFSFFYASLCDGKLIDEFSSGKFFRNSKKNGFK